MSEETETVNGQEVRRGWGAILRAAQDHRVYRIRRKVFERIPFGQDYAGQETDAESCRDCAAGRGQLHVPVCCREQCPRCGGQVLGCDCGVLAKEYNRTFPVPDDPPPGLGHVRNIDPSIGPTAARPGPRTRERNHE